MQERQRVAYEDLDLKIQIDNLLIIVQYLRVMPTKPNMYIKYHCHSSYELHFIPEGYGTLIANGNSYEIVPGTFYLTGPDVYHEQRSSGSDPMVEFCMNLELKVQETTPGKPDYGSRFEYKEIIRTLLETRFWIGKDDCGSMNLFETALQELERKEIGYFHSVGNCISQIVINSARCYSNHKKAEYPVPQRTLNEKREQLLSSFFNKNSSDLSLEQMARELGVSKRQVSRIIRQYYKVNFKEKQMSDRLELGRNWLLTTNMGIEQIAEKVGFTSPGYFCKKFKERWGATPAQLRRSMKKEDKLRC